MYKTADIVARTAEGAMIRRREEEREKEDGSGSRGAESPPRCRNREKASGPKSRNELLRPGGRDA